jgi:nucleotide-binding universal stress UspA family protein
MIDSLVIATDGSESVARAVDVALDFADRFEASVHALYVIEKSEINSAPEEIRDQLEVALENQGEEALESVREKAGGEITTVIRTGSPAAEIARYARRVDADLVATGTRGRHGEDRFLIGSVAERVVRTCPVPVLTIRQLEEDEVSIRG